MSGNNKRTVSGDQPTIVQSIQSLAEARTRLQKAKLAKSPETMLETEAGVVTQHDHSKVAHAPEDLFSAINKVQQSIAAMELKIGSLSDSAQEIAALKRSQAMLKKEAKSSRFKVNVLTNVVIRLKEKLEQQSERILQMQARSMKKNLVISGLDEPQRRQDETPEGLLTRINDYFANRLKVTKTVDLKVWHHFGAVDASGTRPVVIKVRHIDDKFLLLSKGPNLKDLVNAKGKKFFILEQLPDKLQEERRYNQFWIQENKHNPDSKFEMKMSRNKLRINNEPYKKKVHAPNAAEILRLDDEELLVTKQDVLHEGGSKDEQGSEFLAFAVQVKSTECVRKAYRKLKIKYADASHISSAYRLAPPNGPFNQEASDDGEHGMGRFLLKLLQEGNATNVAVFVLRYFGGVHIGPMRFDIARELATKALRKASAWKQQTPQRYSAASLRGQTSTHGLQRAHRNRQPSLSRSQSDVLSTNEAGSETEPEVVKSFKRAMANGSLAHFAAGRHTPGHSSDEDNKFVSNQSSDQEYDASHEETDYDEALSQSETMPYLETTQQQQTFLEQRKQVHGASEAADQ